MGGLVPARPIFPKLKIWCENLFQRVDYIQEIENFRKSLIPLLNLKDVFDTQLTSLVIRNEKALFLMNMLTLISATITKFELK